MKLKSRGSTVVYLFFLLTNGEKALCFISCFSFLALQVASWHFVIFLLFIILYFCKMPESCFHHPGCPKSAQLDPLSHQEREMRSNEPLIMANFLLLLWALCEPHCFCSSWALVLFGDRLSYYEFYTHIICCKMPHIQFTSLFSSKSHQGKEKNS